MSGARWIEVRAVLARVPDDWSPFADAFGRHGCPGSLQSDAPPSIAGYLVETDSACAAVDALARELTALGASHIETREVQEQDWASSWRKFFKPLRVGRVLIRPSWEAATLKPGDVEVVLDPGQAFGTGDHPTTRLCLSLMQRVGAQGKRVLDLGCGSGVLAIAARKLGAEMVLGADIEPVSVDVARANADTNQADARFVVSDGFEEVPEGKWDLILSNIISATLVRLAPEGAARLAPAGAWIVSGVIQDNWSEVLRAMQWSGLELIAQECEGGWVGAAFAPQSCP